MTTTAIILLIISISSAVILFFIWRKNASQLKIFKNIADSVPESMFLLNRHKRIVGIYNLSPAAMAGHQVEDIVGKHLSFFIEDETSPFFQACSMLNESFDRIMVTRETEYFQYMINDDYLEATIKLLDDDYVVSMVRDISVIIKRENSIKAKKQNEVTIALSAGGVVPWSYDVASKSFNSVHENNIIDRIVPEEELYNKIEGEGKIKVKNAIHSLALGESKHCEFLVKVLTNNESLRWVDIHAVPHEYDDNGKVTTIIGSQKDVTDDVETKNELIRLRDKAEESNRLKTAFIANMSHEIRTPLNAIVGFSNLLASTKDEEDIAQFVDIIERNNDLLLNIINDVLDLSKIESGKLDLAMSHINLNTLLTSLEQMAKLKVKGDVQIILDPLDDAFDIESDPNRLTQVITNLLNNALKFTNKGSIRLGCRRMEGTVYFYVVDTGTGIAKEHLESIFERFVKLDSFVQGTGLGLSICKTIVTMLGGEIGAESEVGCGSTFWFRIPYKEAFEAEATIDKSEVPLELQTIPTGR